MHRYIKHVLTLFKSIIVVKKNKKQNYKLMVDVMNLKSYAIQTIIELLIVRTFVDFQQVYLVTKLIRGTESN